MRGAYFYTAHLRLDAQLKGYCISCLLIVGFFHAAYAQDTCMSKITIDYLNLEFCKGDGWREYPQGPLVRFEDSAAHRLLVDPFPPGISELTHISLNDRYQEMTGSLKNTKRVRRTVDVLDLSSTADSTRLFKSRVDYLKRNGKVKKSRVVTTILVANGPKIMTLMCHYEVSEEEAYDRFISQLFDRIRFLN